MKDRSIRKIIGQNEATLENLWENQDFIQDKTEDKKKFRRKKKTTLSGFVLINIRRLN